MKIPLHALAKLLDAEYVNSSHEDDCIYGVSTDSRDDLKGKLFVAIKGERFDGHNFLSEVQTFQAAALCVNRRAILPDNLHIPLLKVDDTLSAYQKIANFHRLSFPELTVIALTGSVGKTSTKEMIRAICSEKFGAEKILYTIGNTNNQIGVPQNLLRLTPNHRIAVIEMGTSSSGEIAALRDCACPDISLINTIAPCHLENLKSLHGVAIEKSAIFSPKKIAVINREAPEADFLFEQSKKLMMQIFSFGKSGDCQSQYIGGNLDGSSFRLSFSDGSSEIVNWRLSGSHQSANAAGAAVIGKIIGLSNAEIVCGLQKTELPGMRMKKTVISQVTYLNDAYNANPASMKASLDHLSDFADLSSTLIVLGDMFELGEAEIDLHRSVLDYFMKKFRQAKLIAAGPRMQKAAEILHTPMISAVKNADEAAKIIQSSIKSGSIVFVKGSRSSAMENALPPEAR